jgi:staphylococcal nuclease domain-containing protein 1
MKDLRLHHKAAGSAPAGFIPKPGDLVSAKFSDGEWYRAKVKKSSVAKKEAQVTFIDYGNQDTVGFKDMRPLEGKFRTLPGQAHDARMRLVTLLCCRR